MKRILILLVAAAALTAATTAGARQAQVASGAKVRLRSTSMGQILVNRRGFTLYVFTRDRRKRDNCIKVSGCAGVWPLLKTKGKPVAGSGVKASLLATIKLANGARQVTYAGHPLYTYVGDSGPGETEYVGFHQFGGAWYAINANGKVVK